MDQPKYNDPAETTVIDLKNYRTRKANAPLMVSIATAADLLEVSTRTIYRLLDNPANGIRVGKIGDLRRIEFQSLVEFVARKGE